MFDIFEFLVFQLDDGLIFNHCIELWYSMIIKMINLNILTPLVCGPNLNLYCYI